MALSFSVKATADINSIWDYSADTWGAEQAERYTRDIRDTCRDLAAGRKLGRSSSVQSGLMKRMCGSHVIYYRDQGDQLHIIRILHSAQDV